MLKSNKNILIKVKKVIVLMSKRTLVVRLLLARRKHTNQS